jgi:hypothetical protein
VEGLIDHWLHCDNLEELMEDIFLEEIVDKTQFIKVLNDIKDNIQNVREIPEEKREYDF